EDLYEEEIANYTVDQTFPPYQLPPNSDGVVKHVRIDNWWAEVRETGRYPILTKMIYAILSCFHGPLVESSFNTMGDILDSRSFNLHIDTYNSYQTVQYYLRARGTKAIDMFIREKPHESPIDSELCNKIQTSSSRYRRDLEKKNHEQESRNKKLKSKKDAKAKYEKEEKEQMEKQMKRKKRREANEKNNKK
ncbi:unnamed protein product, partial [Meganyctiphanes norvegica]